MYNFLDTLKEWYLKVKDEVYDKWGTFFVDENKGIKIPFVFVEDICNAIFGEKEYCEQLEKELSRLQLFNELLIEKVESQNANS